MHLIATRKVTQATEALLAGLSALLIDAVDSGASVGFLRSLSEVDALLYWRSVFAALGDDLHLWVAEKNTTVIGTVQLVPATRQNALHRAEVVKLLVHSSSRGQGIASQLMAEVEAFARSIRRTLLILDTQSGSTAERVYTHLGWRRAGEIPDFAATPGGALSATTFYFKRLTDHLE